jgi:hypothetical protein
MGGTQMAVIKIYSRRAFPQPSLPGVTIEQEIAQFIDPTVAAVVDIAGRFKFVIMEESDIPIIFDAIQRYAPFLKMFIP